MKWTIAAKAFAVLAWGLTAWGSVQGGVVVSDPLTSFDAGSFTVSAVDPIVYDASGAHFGTGVPGDSGRSYQRTNRSNFAQASKVVAEITFQTSTDDQQVFFGIGAGETALFGTPDWSTQFSSASFWPETGNDKFTRFRTANDSNSFGDSTIPGFAPGTHRFRMTYTKATSQLLGEIDLDYAGGPFVADPAGSNFPIVTTSLNGPNGWLAGLLSEPSRVFFGGDDGATFRDLKVTVIPEPATGVLLAIGLAALARRRGQIVVRR
ncbi:MAG: PEP-CTERM sorting domain-containing protein [Planctomycetaceae bacterium]|uniref:Ice-binding protein C-terminal domain-containing protein n=1 Tax=Lacipirellula limnantheis TaxID=2528024 RepID=A0A517TXU0_9BACT|nr:PEP-CTERM sorting domain-containing protein [Lacipirellula limnantheis]MBL9162773.1 PEP-CTERM sorting domain-containing protein [Planctomycetaceae bacterium]QDT73169.1 hypothetical protein I41_23580 [Lacipirellula limnantheis]